MHNSLDNTLDTLAERRAQQITRRVTWLCNHLGLSEPPIVDAAYLRQLPEGTFGRAWIDTLEANGLTPLNSGPRRQQLHDGIHVLTGYGTDLLGEAQVQAFLMGTKFRLFHGVILTRMLLAVALFKPVANHVGKSERFTVQDLLHHLHQAYQRGRQSQLDPDHWQPEYLWYFSLTRVQQMFRI